MVSEGGVHWEQVGAKAELGSFFSALEKLEAAEMAGIGLGTEAFAADPPTSEMGALARLDEATEKGFQLACHLCRQKRSYVRSA